MKFEDQWSKIDNAGMGTQGSGAYQHHLSTAYEDQYNPPLPDRPFHEQKIRESSLEPYSKVDYTKVDYHHKHGHYDHAKGTVKQLTPVIDSEIYVDGRRVVPEPQASAWNPGPHPASMAGSQLFNQNDKGYFSHSQHAIAAEVRASDKYGTRTFQGGGYFLAAESNDKQRGPPLEQYRARPESNALRYAPAPIEPPQNQVVVNHVYQSTEPSKLGPATSYVVVNDHQPLDRTIYKDKVVSSKVWSRFWAIPRNRYCCYGAIALVILLFCIILALAIVIPIVRENRDD